MPQITLRVYDRDPDHSRILISGKHSLYPERVRIDGLRGDGLKEAVRTAFELLIDRKIHEAVFETKLEVKPQSVADSATFLSSEYYDRDGWCTFGPLDPRIRAAVVMLVWQNSPLYSIGQTRLKDDCAYFCNICGKVQAGVVATAMSYRRPCKNPECLSHEAFRMISPRYEMPAWVVGGA